MDAPLTTESLTARTALALNGLVDHGFKYFKSHKHYRQTQAGSQAYIGIDAWTHDRYHYHLAFQLGVQFPEVETFILQLLGEPRPLHHRDRTLWVNTINIGPGCLLWPSPLSGTWSLERLQDFDPLQAQITTFIRDLALPFLAGNTTPEQIRRTLIDTPGRATHQFPYQSILAIDFITATPQQLEDDIQLLAQRYQSYGTRPRRDFDHFVTLIRAHAETKAKTG